jgi:hypothetical protein
MVCTKIPGKKKKAYFYGKFGSFEHPRRSGRVPRISSPYPLVCVRALELSDPCYEHLDEGFAHKLMDEIEEGNLKSLRGLGGSGGAAG